MDMNEIGNCREKHTGNTPRSVMTKGLSTGKGRFTHKLLNYVSGTFILVEVIGVRFVRWVYP